TAEKLGLQFDPDYAGALGPNHDLASLGRVIAGQLAIKPLKDSRVALISVSDRKPERAALIANTLADTYIEHNLDYKLEGARTAMAWLAEQEAELKNQLESSEMKLYRFKKDRNLLAVSMDDKQSMLRQNLTSVNAKLTELRIHILEQDAKPRTIERARNNISEEETLPEIRTNGPISTLRSLFVQLEKEYSDLSSKYGAD